MTIPALHLRHHTDEESWRIERLPFEASAVLRRLLNGSDHPVDSSSPLYVWPCKVLVLVEISGGTPPSNMFLSPV